MGIALQKTLIAALDDLSDGYIQKSPELKASPTYQHLISIIDDLKSEGVYIPKSDYGSVITFVMLTMQTLPDAFKNNPSDAQLKQLCRHCLLQLNSLVKLKLKVQESRMKNKFETKAPVAETEVAVKSNRSAK